MKNKTLIISILILISISALSYAFISGQKLNPDGNKAEFMLVTLMETSDITDAEMVITQPDGTSNTVDLKNYNLYSKRVKDVMSNDKAFMEQLNMLHYKGWELDKTTSSWTGGVSITRYILKKNL